MFESLTEKLTAVFHRLGNKGRLTEADVDAALREVRLALLEADVNFQVAREFVQRVRERALGAEVLQSVSPGQQVVKATHDEMVDLLGGGEQGLQPRPAAPSVIMLPDPRPLPKLITAAAMNKEVASTATETRTMPAVRMTKAGTDANLRPNRSMMNPAG